MEKNNKVIIRVKMLLEEVRRDIINGVGVFREVFV